MAYESLRGALFKNPDKAKPTDRDYGGEVNIEGRAFWIPAWLRTSKKGGKYLGLALKPKDAPSDENKPKPSTAAEFNDEIPF